ncbi:V-set domain-containing T-cell activation inhibitor 1-like [Sparus aurata]|uniref:V-set domain-containing T-cell activation inhibitor 1-like n=1 Tax=Sparus aurata TaxID=8175 RepID=UPI0011C15D69|nr:V-set domain-containing T-cell activation inhibitor 1-like [Sparus aurata]
MELLLLVCLCLLSCSGDAVGVLVEEGSDAVLPCSLNPKVDLTGQVFDWKKDGQDVFMHYADGKTREGPDFIGRVSHFQDQLKNGDASIKITRTKMDRQRELQLHFSRSSESNIIIELVVGAAPKPSVTILAGTNDWSLLQCEAHGDPLPTVEWKDSDNNTLNADTPQISERGGRSYITVNVTVTKTDTYSCVATQLQHSHRIATNIYVHLAGAAPEPVPPPKSGSNAGLVTIIVVLIILLVVIGGLYIRQCIKKH